MSDERECEGCGAPTSGFKAAFDESKGWLCMKCYREGWINPAGISYPGFRQVSYKPCVTVWTIRNSRRLDKLSGPRCGCCGTQKTTHCRCPKWVPISSDVPANYADECMGWIIEDIWCESSYKPHKLIVQFTNGKRLTVMDVGVGGDREWWWAPSQNLERIAGTNFVMKHLALTECEWSTEGTKELDRAVFKLCTESGWLKFEARNRREKNEPGFDLGMTVTDNTAKLA